MRFARSDSWKAGLIGDGIGPYAPAPPDGSVTTVAAEATADTETAPSAIEVVSLSKGGRQPLFMIPADGEEGARFRGLARQLTGKWSLALVRPKGSRHERSVDAIEDAAAQSVAAIRATHQEGPYVLGGFCYGGVVAFEAARILERQGETALLVFFDTPTPGYPNLSTDWRIWVEFLVSRVGISWRTKSPRPLGEYARRISRMALWFAIRRIGPKKTRVWTTGPVRWLWFQAQSLYFSFYTPRATEVPILHFMAKDEADVLLKNSRNGWGKVGKVTTEWLPGNHDRFLLDKGSLPAIADALVSWLEAAIGVPAMRR